MDKEILDSNKSELDINETNIRPDSLNEYIGQSEVKENVDIFIKGHRLFRVPQFSPSVSFCSRIPSGYHITFSFHVSFLSFSL